MAESKLAGLFGRKKAKKGPAPLSASHRGLAKKYNVPEFIVRNHVGTGMEEHNTAWEAAHIHRETDGYQGRSWDKERWGYAHPSATKKASASKQQPGPLEAGLGTAGALAGLGGSLAGVHVGGAAGKALDRRLKRKKTASSVSMMERLAGRIDKTAFSRFEQIWQDRDFSPHLYDNHVVRGVLEYALEGADVIPPLRKEGSAPGGFNVIQVVPDGYGYIIKVSAAPKGVEKKETKVSKDEAKKAVPEKALQVADETGAATMTDVPAEPDPLIEHPQPIEGFGLYKVFTADGKQITGWVVPGLFDPMTGSTTAMHLFANGGQYALQPQPFEGVLVGVSFNLPEGQVVRGLGVFHIATPQAVMVTVPYTVLGEVSVEGQTHYAAQDQMGNDVQIVFSEGIKRPVAAGAGQIVIPSDAKFLPLDNPIMPHSGTTDPMAQAKQAAAPTRLRIRAWDDGTCELSGPVVEKVGSGTHSWVDAAFWMACTGVPQSATMELLKAACVKKAALDIYGLQPLTTEEAEQEKVASVNRHLYATESVPDSVCLLREAVAVTATKEAATLVGAQTVDAMLALNFLTPDNVDSFIEGLPDLEKAATKLAELSLATDLGLQSVPPYAVNRAMDCLEDVIMGLKALKKYEV